MATWRIYAEINGSPLYATMEMDWTDERRAWAVVVEEFESTLQLDLEDEG